MRFWTGCGAACVIDVKGTGDQFAISERGGTHGFDAGQILSQRLKHTWILSSSARRTIESSSRFCQRRSFPRVTRVCVSEGWHSLLQGQIRVLRLDVEERFGSVDGVTHQCLPWLVRHAFWLRNRFQRRQNGAIAFENLKRVSCKKPLLQFGERCHWLEAERIVHKYNPWWGICRGIISYTSYSRTNDYVKLWLRHCVQLYAQ